MELEFDALINNQTWTLEPAPSNQKSPKIDGFLGSRNYLMVCWIKESQSCSQRF